MPRYCCAGGVPRDGPAAVPVGPLWHQLGLRFLICGARCVPIRPAQSSEPIPEQGSVGGCLADAPCLRCIAIVVDAVAGRVRCCRQPGLLLPCQRSFVHDPNVRMFEQGSAALRMTLETPIGMRRLLAVTAAAVATGAPVSLLFSELMTGPLCARSICHAASLRRSSEPGAWAPPCSSRWRLLPTIWCIRVRRSCSRPLSSNRHQSLCARRSFRWQRR